MASYCIRLQPHRRPYRSQVAQDWEYEPCSDSSLRIRMGMLASSKASSMGRLIAAKCLASITNFGNTNFGNNFSAASVNASPYL